MEDRKFVSGIWKVQIRLFPQYLLRVAYRSSLSDDLWFRPINSYENTKLSSSFPVPLTHALLQSTKSRRGYIFTAVCLYVCLSVCVCVRLNSCEQNSSRTDEPIRTRFSLNGCLQHWLGPYWNWWPWVKGQGHRVVIPIFLLNSLLTSLLSISTLLCPIKMKFWYVA